MNDLNKALIDITRTTASLEGCTSLADIARTNADITPADVLVAIKGQVERQTMYANTDGESDSDTSTEAAYFLQKAVNEIERLKLEITIEARCAFAFGHGVGRCCVSQKSDVTGGYKLYLEHVKKMADNS